MHIIKADTMSPIVDVLKRFGEIEWYVIRPSGLAEEKTVHLAPPWITVRYRCGNAAAFQNLSQCISSYKGKLKWCVLEVDCKKNLLLIPERLRQHALFIDQKPYEASGDPEIDESFAQVAIEDFTSLLRFLFESL